MGVHNQSGKPIWATELGVSTCPNPPSGVNCVSEETQATWAGQYIDGWRAKGSWAGVPFWYTAVDTPNVEPYRRKYFGYLRYGADVVDYSAKPARAQLDSRT